MFVSDCTLMMICNVHVWLSFIGLVHRFAALSFHLLSLSQMRIACEWVALEERSSVDWVCTDSTKNRVVHKSEVYIESVYVCVCAMLLGVLQPSKESVEFRIMHRWRWILSFSILYSNSHGGTAGVGILQCVACSSWCRSQGVSHDYINKGLVLQCLNSEGALVTVCIVSWDKKTFS